MFADLVGFTTLSEGRDAEDTREVLSRYFELASEIIGRYGGVVEKFIGDAVMAVWGAPVAREDDAERSVRAALDLVDAVRSLGPGVAGSRGRAHGRGGGDPGCHQPGHGRGRPGQHRVAAAVAWRHPGAVLVGEATQRAAGRGHRVRACG